MLTPANAEIGPVAWGEVGRVRVNVECTEDFEDDFTKYASSVPQNLNAQEEDAFKNTGSYIFQFISPHPALQITPSVGTVLSRYLIGIKENPQSPKKKAKKNNIHDINSNYSFGDDQTDDNLGPSGIYSKERLS